MQLRDFSDEDLAAIHAGKPMRIWSSVLDSWLWWVKDDRVAAGLVARGAKVPIYRLAELRVVQGWPAHELRNVHEFKREFGAIVYPDDKFSCLGLTND